MLTALLIYHQLRYVSLASPSQLAKASLGVAVGFACLFVVISHLEQKNFNYFPRYSVTLKSPKFKLVDSEKTGKFFALSKDFRKRVDHSALETK